MGLGLTFAQGEGPRFSKRVADEDAVNRLAVPDMDKLRYVFDAVRSIRKALTGPGGKARVPLIGFSGSPWVHTALRCGPKWVCVRHGVAD